MEHEVKTLTPAGLAEAFAEIEGDGLTVETVHGPVDLLAELLGSHHDLVTPAPWGGAQIWGAQIVRDNALCAVFVCD